MSETTAKYKTENKANNTVILTEVDGAINPRTNALMKTFVSILTLFLILTLPLTAAAQETSEAAQAVSDAKRDAAADTSRFIPFSVGCLVGGGLMIGTAVAMTKILETESVQEHPIFVSEGDFDVTPAFAILFCLSGAIGCAGSIPPTAFFLLSKPTPPPERLLGKSPEYISAYTRAYKRKGKQIRALWAGCGSFTGGFALMLLAMSL